jgi:hypothetical protein
MTTYSKDQANTSTQPATSRHSRSVTEPVTNRRTHLLKNKKNERPHPGILICRALARWAHRAGCLSVAGRSTDPMKASGSGRWGWSAC